MKKILLFLFMCLSSFLIYENCSALEPSDVNDSNILQYIEEKYPSYIKDYIFLLKSNTNYLFVSSDNIFYLQLVSDSKALFKLYNPSSNLSYSYISLSITDLSESYIKNDLSVNAGNKFAMSIGYIDRVVFYHSNFDIYAYDSNYNVTDTLLYSKNIFETTEPEPTSSPEPSPEPEPSPSPDPIPSAPTEDEGEVLSYDIISLYSHYLIMGLPVALIMVSFEKFIEIFHNFILGKMRK